MKIEVLVGKNRKCHSTLDFKESSEMWIMSFGDNEDDSEVEVEFTPEQLGKHMEMIVKALSANAKPQVTHYGRC